MSPRSHFFAQVQMDTDLDEHDPPVACHSCNQYVRQSQFDEHTRTKGHRCRLDEYCQEVASANLWTIYVRVAKQLEARGTLGGQTSQTMRQDLFAGPVPKKALQSQPESFSHLTNIPNRGSQ